MTVQSEEAIADTGDGSPVFRRILLKLSGESPGRPGVRMDRATIDAIAEEIVECSLRVETDRGRRGQHLPWHVGSRRRHGPRDGRLFRMLATVLNSWRSRTHSGPGADTRVLSRWK
jgi:hypothetical protein